MIKKDIYKDFRILFLYPNVMLQNTIPINLAILSSSLKQEGFNNIALFDTTLYKTQEISGDEIREKYLQFKKWDFSDVGVELKKTDVLDDFESMVKEYDPDIIAITMVEPTYDLTKQLLNRIKDIKKLTIAGGVLPTFSPELILDIDTIDMICIGEGESAIVELCKKLAKGEDYSDIPNLWIKTENGIIKNGPGNKLVDLNELPLLDFDIFEEKRFYRPNRGDIFKTFPIETTRGCPYKCTFCCSPQWIYKFGNKYHRQRNMHKVISELKYQKEKHGMEFIYFSSESSIRSLHRDAANFD